MNEVVLDASVVLKWFTQRETGRAEAIELRAAFQAGRLSVYAPPLLHLEIVNVAARRWLWNRSALLQLSNALERLNFAVRCPALSAIADWSARGLTAYDATYVALAQSQGVALVTDDRSILSIATDVAVPLTG